MLQSDLATGMLTSELKMCLQTGLKSFADALATFILVGRLSLLLSAGTFTVICTYPVLCYCCVSWL